MSDVKSVMIVGVGGQGTLRASRVLGRVLMEKGFDVKLSEVHGMAQRGGSVVTYVKYGKKVYSPIIEKGEADVILSFELCEGARWISYLKKGGKMIINGQKTLPLPVITGAAEYPADVVEKIRGLGADITEIDALGIAEKAGSAKAVNIVLLGVLSRALDFDEKAWADAIAASVPEKALEMNLRAFKMGQDVM